MTRNNHQSTTQQQNMDYPERQSADNGYLVSSGDLVPRVPGLQARYNDLSQDIRDMADQTEVHLYAAAFRLYKARQVAHGLVELNAGVADEYANGVIEHEWTEARVAGTLNHTRVAQFNVQCENLLEGQLKTLLQVTGRDVTHEVIKSPYRPPEPEKKKKGSGFGGLGIFGWHDKEKVIIERVPMGQPGSLVPDEFNFD